MQFNNSNSFSRGGGGSGSFRGHHNTNISSNNNSNSYGDSRRPILSRNDDDDFEVVGQDRSHEDNPLEGHKAKARQALRDFLQKKGVDPSKGDAYQVVIKLQSQPLGVTYHARYVPPSSSSGSSSSDKPALLESKTDVLNHILQSHIQSNSNSHSHEGAGGKGEAGHHSSKRQHVFEAARKETKAKLVDLTLPMRFGSINLFSLGSIVPDKRDHSPVQIYPVGFKCEQLIAVPSAIPGKTRSLAVSCEILKGGESGGGGGRLEFKIIHNTSVFIGVSEKDVWRQFSSSVLKEPEPKENWSFFNLELELLIEGLPESISCKEYRYHAERGYPSEYRTNDAALTHKKNLLNKLEREKRSAERSKAASANKSESSTITSDWMSRPDREKDRDRDDKRTETAEDKVKRNEEAKLEKDRIKKEEAGLKEKKKLEESNLKEKKKIEDSQLKEKRVAEKKQQDAQTREQKRLMEQHLKITSRQDRTITAQERQKIMKVVKTQEVDSTAAIFDFFCREEDDKDLIINESLANTNADDITGASRLDLGAVLDLGERCTMRSLGVEFGSADSNELSFDKLISFAQQLCSFSEHLELDMPVSLELIIEHLRTIAAHEDSVTNTSAAMDEDMEKSNGTALNVDEGGSVTLKPSAAAQSMTIDNGSDEKKDERGDDDEEKEAEWSMEDSSSNKNKNTISNSISQSSSGPTITLKSDKEVLRQKLNRAEAFFDRIQLCLAKAVTPSLAWVFDLSEKDGKGITRSIKLPVNQLTWTEIARQALIVHICKLFGKEKDEILHWLRGSKQSHFESQSNIIKLLRHKMAMISRGDKASHEKDFLHSGLSDDITFASPSYDREDHLLGKEFLKYGENRAVLESHAHADKQEGQGAFEADPDDVSYDDIIASLEKICQPGTAGEPTKYLESFRRCSKVFVKLLKFCHNEKFLSEVREVVYDQYFFFKRPVSITMIYNNLVNQLYGDYESENNYRSVCLDFYRDMRQFLINCLVYPENRAFTARAQKLLLMLDRFFNQWVLAPNKPPVENCNDNHCFISYSGISVLSSVKCGRCTATFSTASLSSDEQKAGAVYETDVRDKSTDKEKWFCPFCVGDFRTDKRSLREMDEPFFVSEWGPSGLVPWFLNKNHSLFADMKLAQNPDISDACTALELLAKQSCSPFLTASNGGNAIDDSSLAERGSWTPFQRVNIYLGLFEVLKGDEKVMKFLDNIHKVKFEKLVKVCKGGNDKQEILTLVSEVANHKAVSICAELLEDMDNKKTGECLICRGEFDDDENTVILCDGCDGEVHLKCIGRSTVPEGDWFCFRCQFPKNNPQGKADLEAEIEIFKDVRNSISKDLVDELAFMKTKGLQSPNHSLLCSICNKNDLDLCSPMVLGQSCREHELYMEQFTPPYNESGLCFPYFPIVNCDNAISLLEVDSQESLPIVHEFCALHLFKTRVNRARHSLIRRRQVVSEIALSLSNAGVLSLGKDDAGRDYWKFPCSEDLLVYAGPTNDPDKADFEQELAKVRESAEMVVSESSQSSSHSPTSHLAWSDGFVGWKRIKDQGTIRNLVDALGSSAGEKLLKKNIQNRLLVPLQVLSKLEIKEAAKLESARREAFSRLEEARNGFDDNDLFQSSSSVDVSESTGAAIRPAKREPVRFEHGLPDGVINPDEIPVRISLVPSKSYDIMSDFVLPSVSVFEEDDEFEYWGDRYIENNRKGKRFSINLLNRNDQPLIFEKKEKVTCFFHIFRVGVSSTIWEEEVEFYAHQDCHFKNIEFRRPGQFKFFFGIKGCEYYSFCEPLEMLVNVVADTVQCGPSFAITQLNARRYSLSPSRQVPSARSFVSHLLLDMSTELACAKSILMQIYISLPNGSLTLDSENLDNISLVNGGSGGFRSSSTQQSGFDNIFSLIADARGWSDYLHQAWIGAVEQATNPLDLISCILILQNYITPKWLDGTNNKLMVALANSRFALNAISYSTIFMRLFSLDNSLNYEKYEQPLRFKRASSTTVQYYDPPPPPPRKAAASSSSSSRTSSRGGGKSEPETNKGLRQKSRINYNYGDDEDEEEEEEDGEVEDAGARSRRRSSRAADVAMATTPSSSSSYSRSSTNPDGWMCPDCQLLNANRSRSCDACGSKKPPVVYDEDIEAPVSRKSAPKSKASSKYKAKPPSKKKIIDDDDEDDDDSNDGDSEDENSEDGEDSAEDEYVSGEEEDGDDDEDDDGSEEDGEEEDAIDSDESEKPKSRRKPNNMNKRSRDDVDEGNDLRGRGGSGSRAGGGAGNKKYSRQASQSGRKKFVVEADDDDDNDDDDVEDFSAVEKRPFSSRKKSRVNYQEDSEVEPEDEVEELKAPKKRIVISDDGDDPSPKPKPSVKLVTSQAKGGADESKSKKPIAAPSNSDSSDDAINVAFPSAIKKSAPVFHFPAYINELTATLAAVSGNQSSGSSSLVHIYEGNNVSQLDIQIRSLLILHAMYDAPGAGLFWTPAIPSKLVRNPMDLGTVCKRVRAGYYGTDIESFSHDIRLVFKNATKLSVKDEEVLELTRRVSSTFEKDYQRLIATDPRPALKDLL